MSKIQYTTFVKDEFQLFCALLSLRSLQVLEFCEKAPLILVPDSLIEEIEAKFPKMKVKNLIRKLGGNLKKGFANGFNPRNSFRAALGNLARKVGDDPMIYFSPNTIFFENPEPQLVVDDFVAARAPDQYWPIQELYGPKLEDIWSDIAKFAGAELDDWVDHAQPKEYWRRYPCASTQLMYLSKANDFAEKNAELSKMIIQEKLGTLKGQGRDLVEATIAATIMQMKGQIVDVGWDKSVVAFDNFPQLVLRLREENVEKFTVDILGFQGLRSILKKIHEYKIIFYQNSLVNVRNNLDSIESDFSLLRINTLIERRKIDKKIKGLVRNAKKAEAEIEAEIKKVLEG